MPPVDFFGAMPKDPTHALPWALSAFLVYGVMHILTMLNKNGKTLKKTHDQVANTHSTNLRDDVDKLAESLLKLTEDVKNLSSSITDGFKRVDHQHGETLSQVNALQTSIENTRQNAHDDHTKIERRIDRNAERLNALEKNRR